MTIKTYADKRSASFAAGGRVREFQAFERQAAKALTKLNAAARLIELRNPPSNRFEALGGDRNDQYSIRINDRWRVCFRWVFTESPEGRDPLLVPGDAVDVEIVDYH
ncbi:type II toxin-antitoxin system RelE/ParE family toxin [Phaeospirillum tilakii]|uniref:Type II toxin-antitoxin system RelE/ParE family toxin n=1 Tax=Phaeospirillum tilakii TaxID=741673 RepID=A0ABW5C953_9PROT